MMSYPLEKDKGKAFGIFWAIFQFGSFIGAMIALAINLQQGHLDAVATSTYIVSPIQRGNSVLEIETDQTSRPLSITGFPCDHPFRYCFLICGTAPTPGYPSRWNCRQGQ